jgi:hypothetical protein
MILTISASQVARITGVSHQCPVPVISLTESFPEIEGYIVHIKTNYKMRTYLYFSP